MIVCHDSYVAKSTVEFCRGWKEVNNQLQSYYPSITVTEDLRKAENYAQLDQLCDLVINIFH